MKNLPLFGCCVGAFALVAGWTARFPPASATQAAPAVSTSNLDYLPAFPGAEGFGSKTAGGRGGQVVEVTNLSDSGPGSLRDAVSEGNRIVVFRVSGTIDLLSRLDLKAPNISIAGQTAPGDGICLRNYPFYVNTHDVIVRYLRVRLGDLKAQETDSITVWRGARNVILDHCSATWSVDEALSLAGDNYDVTVQWCLIAEGLEKSVHAKGSHGYGSLMRASGNVSLHHNLWAHNDARNPRLGDTYGAAPYPAFDVRNNVMYDYGSACSGLTQGIFTANYIGNYIKPGPSSSAKTPITVGGPSEMKFHITGNTFEGQNAMSADNPMFFRPVEIEGKIQVTTVAQPFPFLPTRTTSAAQAYNEVLAGVGATLPARDSADTRIVREVRERGGEMIDSQTEVGGWPTLKTAPAPADSDHDGMPDAWEKRFGLNPQNAKDGAADSDKDGYTNVEECLNATDPTKAVNYRDARNNVSSLKAKL